MGTRIAKWSGLRGLLVAASVIVIYFALTIWLSPPAQALLDEVVDPVAELVEPVEELVEPVEEVVEPVEESQAVEVVEEAAEPVVEVVEETAEPVVEAVEEAAEPVIETLADTAEPVIRVASAAAEPVVVVAGEVAQPVTETVTEVVRIVDQAVTPVTQTVSEVVETVEEALPAISAVIEDTTETAVGAVDPSQSPDEMSTPQPPEAQVVIDVPPADIQHKSAPESSPTPSSDRPARAGTPPESIAQDVGAMGFEAPQDSTAVAPVGPRSFPVSSTPVPLTVLIFLFASLFVAGRIAPRLAEWLRLQPLLWRDDGLAFAIEVPG